MRAKIALTAALVAGLSAPLIAADLPLSFRLDTPTVLSNLCVSAPTAVKLAKGIVPDVHSDLRLSDSRELTFTRPDWTMALVVTPTSDGLYCASNARAVNK